MQALSPRRTSSTQAETKSSIIVDSKKTKGRTIVESHPAGTHLFRDLGRLGILPEVGSGHELGRRPPSLSGVSEKFDRFAEDGTAWRRLDVA